VKKKPCFPAISPPLEPQGVKGEHRNLSTGELDKSARTRLALDVRSRRKRACPAEKQKIGRISWSCYLSDGLEVYY